MLSCAFSVISPIRRVSAPGRPLAFSSCSSEVEKIGSSASSKSRKNFAISVFRLCLYTRYSISRLCLERLFAYRHGMKLVWGVKDSLFGADLCHDRGGVGTRKNDRILER